MLKNKIIIKKINSKKSWKIKKYNYNKIQPVSVDIFLKLNQYRSTLLICD
jgi:hypothetical protein